MTIEEIKKILGIETLDEAQQTLLVEKLEMLVDVKGRERADSILAEEKSKLVEEYETKFEEYKKDITSKFSNFVDSVLDEELEIPEKIMEFAKKGELYHDLIEDFKKRLAIDAGVLSEDVKSLLKEAKDEIVSLKDQVNELTSKNMEVGEDAKEMASQLYIQKKCEGLSEAKRVKVIGLLGELRDKKEIDKKFDFVVEHVINEVEEIPEPEAATKVVVCDKCGKTSTIKGETDICPECGEKMKEVVASIDPSSTTETYGVPITEELNPFNQIMLRWKTILKENKI